MLSPELRRNPACHYLITVAAGALAAFGFAPFGLWPLALVSCLGLLWSLERSRSPRQAALSGWSYGLGFYAVGVSWVYVSINQHGNAAPPLALLLTSLFVIGIALFFSLHGYLYQRLFPNPGRLRVLLVFPALWLLMEWFRSWFLTGFPWLLLGYAPIDSWLNGWAPITGIYGLSGFCALVAGCLFLIKPSTNRQRLQLTVIATTPFLLGVLLQQIQWTQPAQQPPLQVTLVQANVPQALKWRPSERQKIIERYLSLTAGQLNDDEQNRGSELIIWPETAIPLLYDRALPILDGLINELDQTHTGLISGIPFSDQQPQPQYHNSIMALGLAQGLYHKQRLVPFGEYVPLERWLRGLIDFFNLPMSSFSLGPEGQTPLQLQRRSGDRLSISASICYEIVYPDLIADNARDSQLLLTISNDSWFGDSLAPHQHLQMARMRAIENGRYLLRATNDGISALVGPNGKIIDQQPQFVAAVLNGEVQPFTGQTPFSRFGSTPTLLFSLVLLAWLGRTNRRQ